MKQLVLRGSAMEIGRQHGELAKKEILGSIEHYERLFYSFQNINWKTAREQAKLYLPAIESYDLSLIEEMAGVAKGAGVDFEDILALNAKSELASTGKIVTSFAEGCTSIGTSTPLTSDTIIGQNWDWKEEQKRNLLLLKIVQKEKPNILMITEAGIIGKVGFNDHSVGVCVNALMTDKKTNGVPMHLGLRGVLNSTSLQKAILKVYNGQIATAANFLIGYSEGKHKGMILQTEVSPFGIDFVNENSGYGVHSNHICSNILKEYLEEQNILRYTDSIIRYRRAEQLIQKSILNNEDITIETFKRWFADEFNAPGSINRFTNKELPDHRQSATLFSVIINLTKQEMHLCEGMPAYSPYKTISMCKN